MTVALPLLPICDAISANVPVPAGTERDDSGAAPIPYLPGYLYVWPRADVLTNRSPETDQSDFSLRLAVTVEAHETAMAQRSRDVTVALEGAVADIHEWIKEHAATSPAGDLWGLLRVTTIDYEAIRGMEYRGVLLELTGWRFIATEA